MLRRFNRGTSSRRREGRKSPAFFPTTLLGVLCIPDLHAFSPRLPQQVRVALLLVYRIFPNAEAATVQPRTKNIAEAKANMIATANT